MKTLDIISSSVFLLWTILRLAFHIGSGNAAWAAVFGASALLSVGLLIAGVTE